MKIKGVRWWIIGLIMLITIINYLDRGTLNYMWVANIEYTLTDSFNPSLRVNQATQINEQTYLLTNGQGHEIQVEASRISLKEKNGQTMVINKEGIAYDLGLISTDLSTEEAAKQAKDILGTITIFFMIAYGISQLVSGKMYDKIGTRKRILRFCIIMGSRRCHDITITRHPFINNISYDAGIRRSRSMARNH